MKFIEGSKFIQASMTDPIDLNTGEWLIHEPLIQDIKNGKVKIMCRFGIDAPKTMAEIKVVIGFDHTITSLKDATIDSGVTYWLRRIEDNLIALWKTEIIHPGQIPALVQVLDCIRGHGQITTDHDPVCDMGITCSSTNLLNDLDRILKQSDDCILIGCHRSAADYTEPIQYTFCELYQSANGYDRNVMFSIGYDRRNDDQILTAAFYDIIGDMELIIDFSYEGDSAQATYSWSRISTNRSAQYACALTRATMQAMEDDD